MKIPKYILLEIKKRARLAERLNRSDLIITDWIDKNNIQNCEDYIRSSALMVCEPSQCAISLTETLIKGKINERIY